jgi:hypothetical protein
MVAGSASVAAQAGFAGADYGLGTIGYLQLEKDVGDVVSDGLGAQVEATCDVHVGHAVGDQVQYLGHGVPRLGFEFQEHEGGRLRVLYERATGGVEPQGQAAEGGAKPVLARPTSAM